MADTGAPYFIPYVEPTDLVRDYPAADEAQADAIAAALDGIPVLAGIGSNVVQTVKTDVFTTTSGTFVAVTGLSVVITPSSDTSKVLVSAAINSASNATGAGGAFRLMRGTTPLCIADAAGSRTRATATAGQFTGDVTAIEFLDAPATSTATTYSIEIMAWNPSTGEARVNSKREETDSPDGLFARAASTMTAIEVAA